MKIIFMKTVGMTAVSTMSVTLAVKAILSNLAYRSLHLE